VAIHRRFRKALALIWYRALTWYSSPARVGRVNPARLKPPCAGRSATRYRAVSCKEAPSPACQQLSRAQNVYAGAQAKGFQVGHGTIWDNAFGLLEDYSSSSKYYIAKSMMISLPLRNT